MEKQDIINALIENPSLLTEVASDESLKGTVEELANAAVIASRDKVLKEKQNWQMRAKELEEQTTSIINAGNGPATAPEEKPKAPKVDDALNQRLAQLEEMVNTYQKNEADNKKREARDAAFAQLPWKEGGMGMAQQLFSLDSFVVQEDGSVRHKENFMPISEYVTQEWSKSEQAKFFLDTSANGGGGASGSKSSSAVSIKKWSSATPTERNAYALENGVDAYNEWKQKG